MKQYIQPQENINEKKQSKKKKEEKKSVITKKDYGLSENAKILYE